jgi:hypothetical protein
MINKHDLSKAQLMSMSAEQAYTVGAAVGSLLQQGATRAVAEQERHGGAAGRR